MDNDMSLPVSDETNETPEYQVFANEILIEIATACVEPWSLVFTQDFDKPIEEGELAEFRPKLIGMPHVANFMLANYLFYEIIRKELIAKFDGHVMINQRLYSRFAQSVQPGGNLHWLAPYIVKITWMANVAFEEITLDADLFPNLSEVVLAQQISQDFMRLMTRNTTIEHFVTGIPFRWGTAFMLAVDVFRMELLAVSPQNASRSNITKLLNRGIAVTVNIRNKGKNWASVVVMHWDMRNVVFHMTHFREPPPADRHWIVSKSQHELEFGQYLEDSELEEALGGFRID